MGTLAPGNLAMTTAKPPTPKPEQGHWLSLTDLGRIYGISAVHCGRLLSNAGLRRDNGAPSTRALRQGLAYQHHPHSPNPSAVWNEQGCGPVLQGQGLRPMAEHHLVGHRPTCWRPWHRAHPRSAPRPKKWPATCPRHWCIR